MVSCTFSIITLETCNSKADTNSYKITANYIPTLEQTRRFFEFCRICHSIIIICFVVRSWFWVLFSPTALLACSFYTAVVKSFLAGSKTSMYPLNPSGSIIVSPGRHRWEVPVAMS